MALLERKPFQVGFPVGSSATFIATADRLGVSVYTYKSNECPTVFLGYG